MPRGEKKDEQSYQDQNIRFSDYYLLLRMIDYVYLKLKFCFPFVFYEVKINKNTFYIAMKQAISEVF